MEHFWHIEIYNQKIYQNTVYPLFSRNANYAEVKHICNIFFLRKAFFYNSKSVMAHTDIASVWGFFFFCFFFRDKNTKSKLWFQK